MKEYDVLPTTLLCLNIVFGAVSMLFTMGCLFDVWVGATLFAGIFFAPCICALFLGLVVAFLSLHSYLGQQQPRGLAALVVFGGLLLLMGVDLLLWFNYPFSNKFPLP